MGTVFNAEYAAEFQIIHPFLDANGRTGHALTNFMLHKAGLPLVEVPMEYFREYVAVMTEAIDHKNYVPLMEFFKKFSMAT